MNDWTYQGAKPGGKGERAVLVVSDDDIRHGDRVADAAQRYQWDEGGHGDYHIIP